MRTSLFSDWWNHVKEVSRLPNMRHCASTFREKPRPPLLLSIMASSTLYLVSLRAVSGSVVSIAACVLADKYTKVGYYLKTIAFGIVIGMLFHGMGVNLLLNMNHWLASRTPVRKEYRVTEIRFLKPNKLARYRTILPECRILKAVDQDNPDDCLYFHVPINAQVAMGCILHVTIKTVSLDGKQWMN